MHTGVCVCVVTQGICRWGGLVGGGLVIVCCSYWSLDTNNGRAKEDLGCAHTPPPHPLLLSCSVSENHIVQRTRMHPLGGGGGACTSGRSGCLLVQQCPLPHQRGREGGRLRLELHMQETNTATFVTNQTKSTPDIIWIYFQQDVAFFSNT